MKYYTVETFNTNGSVGIGGDFRYLSNALDKMMEIIHNANSWDVYDHDIDEIITDCNCLKLWTMLHEDKDRYTVYLYSDNYCMEEIGCISLSEHEINFIDE